MNASPEPTTPYRDLSKRRGATPHRSSAESRSRHLESAAVAVLLAFGVLILAAGVVGRSGVGVVGAWLIGLGVVMLIARARRERRSFGPEAKIAEIDRVPATAILRSPTELRMTLALVVTFALGPLGWGIGGLLSGQSTGPAVLLIVVALWLAAPAFLALAGRYVAGGVWLTPEKVITRSFGLESTIGWDELGAVAGGVNALVVVRAVPGATVRHRFRAGPWRGGARGQIVGPGLATIDTTDCAIDSAALARVLDHYLRTPDARVELGSPASLATLAALGQLGPSST